MNETIIWNKMGTTAFEYGGSENQWNTMILERLFKLLSSE